ncbi:hypothetical protein [Streptomyces niveus]|uniref:hypothetical protein n=1 Tax=Streptomyces niveus TaxID=193462 RepID=UPI00342AAC63
MKLADLGPYVATAKGRTVRARGAASTGGPDIAGEPTGTRVVLAPEQRLHELKIRRATDRFVRAPEESLHEIEAPAQQVRLPSFTLKGRAHCAVKGDIRQKILKVEPAHVADDGLLCGNADRGLDRLLRLRHHAQQQLWNLASVGFPRAKRHHTGTAESTVGACPAG